VYQGGYPGVYISLSWAGITGQQWNGKGTLGGARKARGSLLSDIKVDKCAQMRDWTTGQQWNGKPTRGIPQGVHREARRLPRASFNSYSQARRLPRVLARLRVEAGPEPSLIPVSLLASSSRSCPWSILTLMSERHAPGPWAHTRPSPVSLLAGSSCSSAHER